MIDFLRMGLGMKSGERVGESGLPDSGVGYTHMSAVD
jgi:hypothetical protein